MSYKIKHRSGGTIPTTSDSEKTFETKQEAKNYMADYGLGGKVIQE